MRRYRALAKSEAVDRVIARATPAELQELFRRAGQGGLRRYIGRIAVGAGRIQDVDIVETTAFADTPEEPKRVVDVRAWEVVL